MTSDPARVESGRMGRVAYARIAPNEDLVQGVEKLCLAHGFRNAFVTFEVTLEEWLPDAAH